MNTMQALAVELVQVADAAEGDSNDTEIAVLRSALSLAVASIFQVAEVGTVDLKSVFDLEDAWFDVLERGVA
jgi:hypothetical protein